MKRSQLKRSAMKRGTKRKRSAISEFKREVLEAWGHLFASTRRREKRDAAWEKAYHSREFVEFTRMSPSSATLERGPCQVSHSAKSRAAGGTYLDALPLTPAEHAYEHMVGVETAWAQWGKDPKAEAREHWQRFLCSWQYREYLKRVA